jgi:hypothetical protein
MQARVLSPWRARAFVPTPHDETKRPLHSLRCMLAHYTWKPHLIQP